MLKPKAGATPESNFKGDRLGTAHGSGLPEFGPVEGRPKDQTVDGHYKMI